jgi:hypothetical protein
VRCKVLSSKSVACIEVSTSDGNQATQALKFFMLLLTKKVNTYRLCKHLLCGQHRLPHRHSSKHLHIYALRGQDGSYVGIYKISGLVNEAVKVLWAGTRVPIRITEYCPGSPSWTSHGIMGFLGNLLMTAALVIKC